MDTLSWYQPYHDMTLRDALSGEESKAGWGIYLSTAGIEVLAEEAFVPAGFDPTTSLRAATQALYAHQLFHYLSEQAVTVTEVEDVSRTDRSISYYHRHRTIHPGNACPLEETLANRHALRLSAPQHRAALQSWMSKEPAGYRDVEAYADEATQGRGLRQLISHSTGTPVEELSLLTNLAYDLDHAHTPIMNIPAHLVISHDSAYAAHRWTWE